MSGKELYHGGHTFSTHSDLFIEPQNQWGAILLMNLGGGFTGLPLEQIQAGVARLLAGLEPSPAAGLSLTALYVIIDGVLAALSALLLWPVLRMRRWQRQVKQRLLNGRKSWRLIATFLRVSAEILLPLLIILGIPVLLQASWTAVLIAYPDIGAWVLIASGFVLIVGLVRAALLVAAFRRKAPISTPDKTLPAIPSIRA